MKIRLAKKYISKIGAFIYGGALILFLSSCKPGSERLRSEAYSEIEKGHFRIAADLLERSAEAEKTQTIKFKTFLEAARITRFEIQDYERSIRLYKKIILESPEEDQRIESQKAISEIYLENIQNYALALRELQILEPLISDEKLKEKTKLKIALSQYLTGNYQSAIEEIDISLKSAKYEMLYFLKLKAQVFVAQKKFNEAIETYLNIFKKDPAFFENENLFMATSVVYEEKEEYSAALEYLTKYEKQIKDKAYYELRTKRLKERLVNKPFYKGKRK